jgi:hypothetical protein
MRLGIMLENMQTYFGSAGDGENRGFSASDQFGRETLQVTDKANNKLPKTCLIRGHGTISMAS